MPQSKLSIERVVVLLTPVFAALASWLSALVASNVPGAPHLDPSGIEGIEIAAVLAATGIAAKWLHGRQLPAIAQLAPHPAEVVAINAAAKQWLSEHGHELQGPAGPAGASGVSADQVIGFIRDEIANAGGAIDVAVKAEVGRLLQAGLSTPPQ